MTIVQYEFRIVAALGSQLDSGMRGYLRPQ